MSFDNLKFGTLGRILVRDVRGNQPFALISPVPPSRARPTVHRLMLRTYVVDANLGRDIAELQKPTGAGRPVSCAVTCI
jgi:hypothetical protein